MSGYTGDKKRVLERFFRLRGVLDELSQTLDIVDIPDRDMGVLQAVFELTRDAGTLGGVTAQMVADHPSCTNLSPATLYRSLISLCEKGAIKCADTHPKHYWIEY